MVIHHRLQSPLIADNLLGNSAERDLVIYLPPSYEESRRRYPTVYLFHGFATRATHWLYGPALYNGSLHRPLEAMMDDLLRNHHVAEMIIVMPDGWGRLGCTQWVNSTANGSFEDHIAREVVPYVDRNFRSIPQRTSRAVLGQSSGGFAAWHIATRHSDLFAVAAMLSMDSCFEITHKPLFYRFYDSIYPAEPNGPINGNIDSWLCYGLSAAYTANPSRPPYFTDLPIEYPTGRVIPELWDKWLELDPVISWRSRIAQLKSLSAILLDCGSHDDFQLHYGHRQLSLALSSVGVRHDYVEYEGTHFSEIDSRIESGLKWISEVTAHGIRGASS